GVRWGAAPEGAARRGRGTRVTITQDDARAIQAEIPVVVPSAPMVRGSLQAEYANFNSATTLYGVTPEYLDVREWNVRSGRTLTVDDVIGSAKVALLGQTLAEDLFAEADPLGPGGVVR